MKRYIKSIKNILILAGFSLMTACASYLDVVPDDVATMEHAFSTRNTTQRFLMTCYWYLPNVTDRWANIGLTGGDENWWCIGNEGSNVADAAYLAKGAQNINDPYLNFWDGGRSGKNLFVAIRDCNIFLENVHTPTDIEEYERKQWAAEAKFLKAYFHFYLLQLYGPIPIIRENLPVNATSEEVRVYREPVDEVVNYIVELIDEAMPDLLLDPYDTRANDAGRITQPIAASIKAKALVLAASPLFNGTSDNPPQFSLVDNRGVELFPQTYQPEKWTRAAEAVREAIEISYEAGHRFYTYQIMSPNITMSPVTKLKCTLRGAVTEKFNSEIIWPSVAATSALEIIVAPNFGTFTSNYISSEFGPTLKIAEEFYTKNGLPINEDREWVAWVGENFVQRYDHIQVSSEAGSGIDGVGSLSEDHRYYIGSVINNQVQSTAKLHFYREPRFYAWIGFDRGIWEMNGITNEAQSQIIRAKAGEDQGQMGGVRHLTCGYFAKKLVNMETVKNTNNSGLNTVRYTYPIIRLSDLYLLYAEALNESKSAPDAEVYRWIDSVRLRAGLEPIVQSYEQYAIPSQRTKPARKDGMRDIIKRERLIELSFESQRFFDLLRWKDAIQYLNEPVKGWNFQGATLDSYYTVTTYWDQRVFNTRDYFWPLRLETLQINSNLKQNPGW
jgi:hypothetical protein